MLHNKLTKTHPYSFYNLLPASTSLDIASHPHSVVLHAFIRIFHRLDISMSIVMKLSYSRFIRYAISSSLEIYQVVAYITHVAFVHVAHSMRLPHNNTGCTAPALHSHLNDADDFMNTALRNM